MSRIIGDSPIVKLLFIALSSIIIALYLILKFFRKWLRRLLLIQDSSVQDRAYELFVKGGKVDHKNNWYHAERCLILEKTWRLLGRTILAILTGLIVSFSWHYLNVIKPDKIKIYLPYAYEYKYKTGGTYKGATNVIDDMEREITRDRPIPFRLAQEKLTLGLLNTNIKTLEDVTLYLIIPNGAVVTGRSKWVKYTDREYYTRFEENLNNNLGLNAPEPIYIKFPKPGYYKVGCFVIGKDIKNLDREIGIEVYE